MNRERSRQDDRLWRKFPGSGSGGCTPYEATFHLFSSLAETTAMFATVCEREKTFLEGLKNSFENAGTRSMKLYF
jgi:hypothetical protein